MRCRSAGKIWDFSVEVVSQRRVEPFVCVFALHDTRTRSDRAQQNGRRTAARSRLVERESFELLELLTTSELE